MKGETEGPDQRDPCRDRMPAAVPSAADKQDWLLLDRYRRQYHAVTRAEVIRAIQGRRSQDQSG